MHGRETGWLRLGGGMLCGGMWAFWCRLTAQKWQEWELKVVDLGELEVWCAL